MINKLKNVTPSWVKNAIPKSAKRQMQLLLLPLIGGGKYECVFCGFKAKEWSPVGLSHPVLFDKDVIGCGRRLGGCFKCESMDRERHVYAYLKFERGIFNGPKNLKILHIAPWPNFTKAFLDANFEEYVCGDLFTPGYSYAPHVQNMNILDIPYPADYFDLVICNHVLEHIPDDRKAMSELYRVLKQDSFAILQVPISANSANTDEEPTINNSKEQERRFGQFDHVRIYGQDYVDRLASVGFNVERVNLAKKYPAYGLIEREDLFVSRK